MYHRVEKTMRWDARKNETLQVRRGVAFEAVVVAIGAGGLLDVVAHPKVARCPGQRVLVVAIDDYVHLVPFVEERDYLFLKTIIPSRKATRDYLRSRLGRGVDAPGGAESGDIGMAGDMPDTRRADTRRAEEMPKTRKAERMAELDADEVEILRAYERGELVSVATREEIARVRTAARATAVKDKRVNIRLSSGDLADIQARALEEGIPYQTLIAGVLHKYVTGRLVERPRGRSRAD